MTGNTAVLLASLSHGLFRLIGPLPVVLVEKWGQMDGMVVGFRRGVCRG